MTATFYRSIEIRTAPRDLLDEGLPFFQNQGNFLLVFAEKANGSSRSSNTQWSIDYIGSLRNYFLKYCAHFTNSVHDGLISTNLGLNSVDCYRMLENAIKSALPIETDDFLTKKIHCCTWASSQYNQLKSLWPDLAPVLQEGQIRYRQFLRNHSDIATLFLQARQVHTGHAHLSINNLSQTMPWVCDTHAINGVANSID